MRFINNDGVVLHQQTVLLDLSQQNPVGHQFHHGVIADVIAKTHFVTDAATRFSFQLFGNTVGDGSRRQATRLGMANQPLYPTPQFHTDFRQLGGFPRTGFPRHDHHLVIAHGFKNRLFFLANGQVVRVFNHRTRGFAQHDFTGSLFNFLRHLLNNGLLSIRIFNLFNAV